MERTNVIANPLGGGGGNAAAVNGRRVVAVNSLNEDNLGCDCPRRMSEGDPTNYVDHYCGYKREYPHR